MRRSHKLRLMAMLAVGATVAAAVSGLASAGPNNGKGLIQKETVPFSDSFEEENFCDTGETVQFEVVGERRSQVVLRGRDQLPYFAAHINRTETITNPANGEFVISKATFVDKDLRVTDNGDGTSTLLVLATGVSKLYGENGKVIAMNPGQVRFEIRVDSNGDEIGGSFMIVKESTGRSDDYCEAAVSILFP